MTKNLEMKKVKYLVGEDEFECNVYTDINMSGKLSFISQVTDMVVDENNYYPIIKQLVFDYMLVEKFTDIDIDITEYKRLEDIEYLVNNSNIADVVVVNIKDGIYDELMNGVNKNIEYKTGIHENNIDTALCSLVNGIESKIKGYDTGKIIDILNQIGNSEEFTMEKLIDVYTKSDAFKNNKKAITKSKSTKAKANKQQ